MADFGVSEIAMAAMAASSAAVSAAGAISSAQAQSSAADYNAQIAQQNAQIATSQGQAASEAQARSAAQQMGASVAAFGASGAETDTGSPTDVMASGVRQATLDNLTTQYNTQLKVAGQTDQANLDQSNASNAMTAGYFNATSSLLNGASKAAYYAGNGPSGFGTPVPSFA